MSLCSCYFMRPSCCDNEIIDPRAPQFVAHGSKLQIVVGFQLRINLCAEICRYFIYLPLVRDRINYRRRVLLSLLVSE